MFLADKREIRMKHNKIKVEYQKKIEATVSISVKDKEMTA